MQHFPDMIPKSLLIEWQISALRDLEGLPVAYIAKQIGLNHKTLQRVLELNGDKFKCEIIESINRFRQDLKDRATSLTR